MKIAKKVIIALAVIILLAVVITFIIVKYEESKNKVDEVVALECPAVSVEGNSGEMIDISYTYYMLQSSRGSRETSNYYKNAYTIATDFAVPPFGSSDEDKEKFKKEREYYKDEEYIVIRSNKYIHFFSSLYTSLKFLEQQSEFPPHKELADIKPQGTYEALDNYFPYHSFNRETVEKIFWDREKQDNTDWWKIKPFKTQCKEVDPSIPLNLVKQTIDKAAGGEKKI